MESAKDRLVCGFRRWCRFNELPNDFDERDEDGYFEDGIYQFRSISHNIWTGKGMKEINLEVKEWLLLVDEDNLAEIVEKFAL